MLIHMTSAPPDLDNLPTALLVDELVTRIDRRKITDDDANRLSTALASRAMSAIGDAWGAIKEAWRDATRNVAADTAAAVGHPSAQPPAGRPLRAVRPGDTPPDSSR